MTEEEGWRERESKLSHSGHLMVIHDWILYLLTFSLLFSCTHLLQWREKEIDTLNFRERKEREGESRERRFLNEKNFFSASFSSFPTPVVKNQLSSKVADEREGR